MTMPHHDWELVSEQRERVINSLIEWLKIRKQFETNVPGYVLTALDALEQLSPDIYHSDLLLRLIAGDKPLPYPPPRVYGYPWWELIENGYGETISVSEFAKKGTLLICQSPWKIIECVSSDEFICKYDDRPETGLWRVKRTDKSRGLYSTIWAIERVDSTPTGAKLNQT